MAEELGARERISPIFGHLARQRVIGEHIRGARPASTAVR